MSSKKTFGMKGITAAVMAALLTLAGVPAATAWASEPPAPIETTLEQLSDLVSRLEAELAAMEAPVAERLEERLEELLELIESILSDFDRPQSDGDRDALKVRILRLDLAMHRLLFLLENLVEEAVEDSERRGAADAIEGLRRWMGGYVEKMTTGMEPERAERFEAAAHQAMRDLVRRLAAMTERVRPSEESRPLMARMIERLERLLFRLDGFILEHLPTPHQARRP